MMKTTNMTNIQQHIEENENKFDEEFYEGARNSVHCKKHEIYATPYEIKQFLHSSQLSLLEEVKKIIDGKKMEFDPETAQDIFTDPTAVDGYNQALQEVIDLLSSV